MTEQHYDSNEARKPECDECQNGRYGCGECHRNIARLTDELAALRAERDHYFAKMESVNLQRQRNEVRAIEAEAERDAMRPVFEAACKARDSDDYAEDMWRAVDAFRAAQQETTDA